eukprot:gb/GFBE01073565.1/.p1 GENE.gb/GFBE01073565.1/~~gb/GFBE01073565.1/.p1  ORF type:complete len:511 (+),score=76.88 gb/GFBE01073565.1/:1-1533(+)
MAVNTAAQDGVGVGSVPGPLCGGSVVILWQSQWEFLFKESSEEWQPYPWNCQSEMESMYSRWLAAQAENPQSGNDFIINLSGGTHTYKIDFARMHQQNTSSRKVRSIRRLWVPNVQCLMQQCMFLWQSSLYRDHAATCQARIASDYAQFAEDLCADAELDQLRLQTVMDELTQSQKEAERLRAQSHERSDAADRLKLELDELRNENSRLRAQEDDLTRAKTELETSIEALQTDKATLGQELYQLKVHVTSLELACAAQHQQSEIWRNPHVDERALGHLNDRFCLESGMLSAVEKLLHGTSHSGNGSICSPMSSAKVVSVIPIVNRGLWASYQHVKQDIRRRHMESGILTALLRPDGQEGFMHTFPWIRLDQALNERLVFHGTSRENLQSIAVHGFEPRLSKEGGLYGEGVYFAEQSCKSVQYSKPDAKGVRYMLVARAVFGVVYPAQAPMRRQKLPPLLNADNEILGRYDSVLAEAGVQNGRPGGQQHREFILFKGEQAFPEFVIAYKTT